MGFIFGGNTGVKDPAELARQRAIVESLMASRQAPRNVGEGISAFGDGIVANMLNRRANKAEVAGQESASGVMDPITAALLGGGATGGAPTAPQASVDPMAPPAQTGGDVESFIRQAAQQRGIDPEIALRVAQSEGGLSDPFRQSDMKRPDGSREESFGPFQLFMGGGMGNDAMAAGIDPRKDWQGGVNFALDQAKEKGWKPWYGAKAAGIEGMQGIGGDVAQPAPQQQTAQSGPTVQQLLQAAQNPWLNENQRGIVNMLLKRQMGGDKSSLINAGDGQLYDPSTKSWISAPGGSRKAPQVVELFDETTGQPYKATWDQEAGQYKRVGGIKARSGMSLKTNPDGTVTLEQGDMSKAPKLTESEGRNAGFYGRGVESHKVISGLEGEGTSLWNKGMQALPGGVGNYGLGPDAQKFQQAKRNFINAVLRRESGAVISPEEFANGEQQYFPQPGDGPEVIAQKRKNRETTIRGLEVSSGQGAALATQPPTMPDAGGVIDFKDFFGGQ